MDKTPYPATGLPSNPGELARVVNGLLAENFQLKQQNLRLLKHLMDQPQPDQEPKLGA